MGMGEMRNHKKRKGSRTSQKTDGIDPLIYYLDSRIHKSE